MSAAQTDRPFGRPRAANGNRPSRRPRAANGDSPSGRPRAADGDSHSGGPHAGNGDSERDSALDRLLRASALLGPSTSQGPGCTLVGGVGLPWLRDLDFGTNWLARAASWPWPDGVILEDLSYGAHRVMHRLQELEPSRVVLIGCTPRGDDPPGAVRRYSLADTPAADPEEVHERLSEAVGGIIDLDHTIAVCRHWGALPADTVVIEVEPAESQFGLGFSRPVERAVDTVLAMVLDEVSR